MSVSEFIASLKKLSEHWQYEPNVDKMIHDRLVAASTT